MKLFRFFLEGVKISFSKEMIYKVNFIIRMMTLLSFDMILPLITLVIYSKTNGFAGWSFDEIVFFQGVFILVNGIDRFLFRRANWKLSSDIRSGSFDRYLLYPINTLAYISFSSLAVEHIAQITVGIILLIYSAFKMQLIITLGKLLMFFTFLLLGLLLLLSIQIFQYAIIIRAVMIGRLGEFFMQLKRYGEYPIDIYNNFISTVFRYILPLAALAYYPSQVLLKTIESDLTIIIAAILALYIFSITLWNHSLKTYTSAGG